MKGAIAEPLLRKMRMLSSNRLTMIGKSQNFFLTLRKPQRSRKKSILFSVASHSIRMLNILRFI